MHDPIYSISLLEIKRQIGTESIGLGPRVLIARTVPIQLFEQLVNAIQEILEPEFATVLTTNPIPRERFNKVDIVHYTFSSYFDKNRTPDAWCNELKKNNYDMAIIPYPADVLAGYDNVKECLGLILQGQCIEIGCGGNYKISTLSSNTALHQSGPTKIGELVDGNPTYVTINITEHCNLRCVMCDIDDEADYPSISLDQFKNIADQLLPGCRVLTLNGYVGEPLLHPEFTSIIEYIDTHWSNLSVGFATNATAFSEKRIQSIINSRSIKDIRISLSAAKKQTYESVMERAKFDDTMRKISDFMQAVKTLPLSARPIVTFSFVAMQQNINELPEFVKLAADFGADRVLVWDVQISQSRNMDFSLRGNSQYTAQIFAQARNIAEQCNVNLLLPDAYELRDEYTGSAGGEDQPFRCLLPWSHMYISPNGEVSPCCFFNESMGDLNSQNFRQIWNGPSYRKLRHDTEAADYPVPCRSCPENRMLDRGNPQFVEHKNHKGLFAYKEQWVNIK